MTSVKGAGGPAIPFVDTSAPPAAATRVETPVVEQGSSDAFSAGGSFAAALATPAGASAPPSLNSESARATLKALEQLLPSGLNPPGGVSVAEALQATSLDGFAHAPSVGFAAGQAELAASMRVMFDGSLPLSSSARMQLARRLDGWRAWIGAEPRMLANLQKLFPRGAALLAGKRDGLRVALERRRGQGVDPKRARSRLLQLGWDEEDLDSLDDSWWPDLAQLVEGENESGEGERSDSSASVADTGGDSSDVATLLRSEVGELEGVHVDDAAAWIAAVASDGQPAGLLTQVEQGFASLAGARSRVLLRDRLLAAVESALIEKHGAEIALAAQHQVKVWQHDAVLSFALSPFEPNAGEWQRDPSPFALTLSEMEAVFSEELTEVEQRWTTLSLARDSLANVLRAKVALHRDVARGLQAWARIEDDVIRGRK